MRAARSSRLVWWWPLLAAAFYALASLYGVGGTFRESPLGIILALALLPLLFGVVFAAVHHSELIAMRTGEPFGTLVLTVSVTVIEVALITSVMAAADNNATLARDSVFAVIMLVCNGLVGLCILIGGIRFHEQSFRVPGASSYLTVLMTLAILTLVLPNYAQSVPGPYFSTAQLGFVSVITIALYGAFLYIQTVRHRDYFIIEAEPAPGELNGESPSLRGVAAHATFLLLSLVIVVLLSKKFAAVLGVALAASGAPAAIAGIIVALLVLLPEAIAAVSAARRNQLQKSINLALGSSLATIGLTVPAVAVVSIAMGRELVLGLDQKDTVLLAITFVVSLLTFATGRTNILSGFVHLMLMATFAFLVLFP
jgi:Ca2+:H+ antiporter